MGWLALVLLFFGAVYLAIHYHAFRRGIGYLALGLVGLVAVGIAYIEINSRQDEQRRRLARSLISGDDLDISQDRLSLGTFGGMSEMSAVVTNKSPYPLAGLAFRITISDCPHATPPPPPGFVLDAPPKGQQAARCAVVGEAVARSYSIDIPAGQKRAFRAHVTFRDLPALRPGEWSWYYSIEEAVAKYP